MRATACFNVAQCVIPVRTTVIIRFLNKTLQINTKMLLF